MESSALPTITTGQPHLAKQDLSGLDVSKLTPLSPEVISRQATINIGKTLKIRQNVFSVFFVKFKPDLGTFLVQPD